MLTIVLLISVGVGVTALIGSVAMFLRPTNDHLAENRLSMLTNARRGSGDKQDGSSLLTSGTLDDTRSFADEVLSKLGNIQHLMDQANVDMSGAKFLSICALAASVGAMICIVSPVPKYLLPVFALVAGGIPIVWLMLKRNKRMAKFNRQLPEALELLSRSLRAGHSLGAGMGLVASEMQDPISSEFGRAFEEQNLGITLEDALEDMTNRVPNMDLRFFATAVTLQKQTGGDLAEILDKIGHLVRERFKLAGAIQALTGEGRLSGIVLLALPPSLFVVMFYLNHDYAMVLFRDETGRLLLGAALLLQFVGALVIRKIINIKV
ncbi:type II secretion system F family protein [Aureliella helgolandensis]|uniref:Bacterial type II secretion system protein F domain protein n=1 Tax=Aureliella helgolandensis TaxID=2527968 RepID=A0A518G0K7_9BACT|nr:type II secretion system F family protein [Aureliella helgolandensis]QDV22138.1 Bacterial type II secretion system protein F domain protein [Aureliella helgolandensis]